MIGIQYNLISNQTTYGVDVKLLPCNDLLHGTQSVGPNPGNDQVESVVTEDSDHCSRVRLDPVGTNLVAAHTLTEPAVLLRTIQSGLEQSSLRSGRV